jgi:PadR family transcriptional regulator PadR
MSAEEKISIGRIEVAPEALHTIARLAALNVDGVTKVAPVPADVGRLFRRTTAKHDGVALDFSDGKLRFDIYLYMSPNVNVLETSRRVQAAVVEAMDKMVGLPVEWINVHVEDIVYTQDTT